MKNSLQDLSFLEKEELLLAPYASLAKNSLGRKYSEPKHPYRTVFQRDRDRIIHSYSFRKLEYKTQVFLTHEDDHFRTRLTHSLEVSQIARSIARALQLNEDLTESIALAHDLGHTPFGHCGEHKLAELMKNDGGFEHNEQSSRIVELLEKRYPDFPGLNLSWETREGLIKHSDYRRDPNCQNLFKLQEEHPTLEAQLIEFADEIAYNNHDLDDGYTSKMLHLADIEDLKIWQMAKERTKKITTITDEKIYCSSIIRQLINLLVSDLITTTTENIKAYKISSTTEARKCQEQIVNFSQEINQANNELKLFLRQNLYLHHNVVKTTIRAEKIIEELFKIYCQYPEALPKKYRKEIDNYGQKRVVADYIAAMTDFYAINEYKNLTGNGVFF